MGEQQVGVEMDDLVDFKSDQSTQPPAWNGLDVSGVGIDEPTEMHSTMGKIVVTMLGDNLEEDNAHVESDGVGDEVYSRKTELPWRQLQWWTEKRYLRNWWLILITLVTLGMAILVLLSMNDWNNREGKPSLNVPCTIHVLTLQFAAHFISLSLPLTLNVDGCDVYMPYSTLGRVRSLEASVPAH